MMSESASRQSDDGACVLSSDRGGQEPQEMQIQVKRKSGEVGSKQGLGLKYEKRLGVEVEEQYFRVTGISQDVRRGPGVLSQVRCCWFGMVRS
eukprot:3087471-Rhodomonas_salina.3